MTMEGTEKKNVGDGEQEWFSAVEESGETIDLAEYYRIIRKHRWLIFTWFVIVLAVTAIVTLKMTPVYEASGTLVIEVPYSVSPVTGEKIDYAGVFDKQMSINTHSRLITSRPVLEIIIRKLGMDPFEYADKSLETNPLTAFFARIRQNIRMLLKKDPSETEVADPELALIEKLKGKIEIRQVRDTHLLKVNAQDYDPETAKKIVNALTESYIEFDADSRMKSSRNIMDWMTAQLYETKKKLEDSESDFLTYKQNERIFSIEGKQDVITQQIQDFNNVYLETRNRRLEIDARLEELERLYKRTRNYGGARVLMKNDLIDTLYQQIVTAEVELNRLSNIYKSKHPKIVQITSKIRKTRAKLNEELNREIENLKTQRSVLFSREEVLNKTMDGFENDALETNKKEFQYKILQRNVDTNRKLYETLLEKIEASNIDESMDVSNIRIVEKAVAPNAPVKPNIKRNLILGAVLGLMLGIGMVFLKEYMDQTLRTEEDIQKYLGLPVLSVIPEAEKT